MPLRVPAPPLHPAGPFAIALALLLPACARPEPAAPDASRTGSADAHDTAGLRGVLVAAPGVLVGPHPADDAAFAALRARGVRLIVSVDAVPPDLARAHTHSLRYAHLPISYSVIAPERTLALAALLDAPPGAVYVHCHHGRHRAPAAVAAALRGLGRISAGQAEALLSRAGTSTAYPGLWQTVRAQELLDPARVRAVDTQGLPRSVPPGAFTQCMIRADEAAANLELARAARWVPPPAHPDLAPAADAAQIAEVMRALPGAQGAPLEVPEFRTLAALAAERARRLELAILAGQAQAADAAHDDLEATCAACHQATQ
ncbi:MAG TPA: hypothetical protein VD963_10520 [Phycisphaerales bacterium]|nr:hypothetical protein [Phycisphaerales bacterium]